MDRGAITSGLFVFRNGKLQGHSQCMDVDYTSPCKIKCLLTLEIEITAFQTSRRRKYSTCVCRSDSEEGFLFLPLVKYKTCKERDHEKAENGLRAEVRP